MKSLKIVIFGWASSTHIKKWSKGLTEKGCKVKVISLGGEPINGIETVVFPRISRYSYLKFAKQTALEAIKFNPDIVHVHYAGGFSLWGLKTKGIPLVVSVWGSDINMYNGFFKRYYIKKALKKAHAITVTSESLKSDVLNFFPAVEFKITIIPFGVQIPQFISEPPSVDVLKICSTKALRPIYGPDTLIKAISIVRNYISGLEVNIAGEGEMKAELEKLIVELGLEHTVNLVGLIDNKDIFDFIGNHHLSVMPSRQESFGVAALETGAAGRPVIASYVGGIPEIVKNNETGLLVKPDDPKELAEAIMKLCSEPESMNKMGFAGYEFVKNNFSLDSTIEKMINLYKKILNEKN